MEEEDEIKQSHQQEKTKEEKLDKQDETSCQEDKISPKLKEISIVKQALESHQQEESKEEKTHKQDETRQENKVSPMLEERRDKGDEISIETQALEAKAGKVGEIQLIDSSKKPKQGLKQIQKSKLTVPQPFSLATERRMSRERRAGSMDFRDSTPKLSKSISLNYKVNAQSSLGAEGTSHQRHVNSATTMTRISSKPKVPTTERIDKRVENALKTKDKIQVKEVETKKAQANAKKQEREELEISKLRKSSTFKASPLPSFYHRKDLPPKPEIKKMPATRPKSPLLGQRSKSIPSSEHIKKPEDKGKGVSRIISNSAKEAITKLLRTTRKSPNNQKVMGKGVISTA